MEKTLDIKLRNMADGSFAAKDFVIADAKDADMAFGINSFGARADGRPLSVQEYRERIRAVVEQGIVDIMLMSASTLEVVSKDMRAFERSAITPAARGNDASDVWVCRNSSYVNEPSRPWATASIDAVKKCGADLGLYSTTFNNNLENDMRSLEAFARFRGECETKGFRYFWEVFNPNAARFENAQKRAQYVNDCIARTLAGVCRAQRPQFLKIAYNGPRAMEELAAYDTSMPVGILGGGAGTTHDAFRLLEDARKYGARVALFGRKINSAEDQLEFIRHLRLVADGALAATEAVRSYHDALKTRGIKPRRPLAADMALTETALGYGK